MKKDSYNKKAPIKKIKKAQILFIILPKKVTINTTTEQKTLIIKAVFIAFHGAILLLAVNTEYINNILKSKMYQMKLEQFFKYNLMFMIEILIVILVICMVTDFYSKNKLAGILQIPYLIWILFATYLNFAIYLLNK